MKKLVLFLLSVILLFGSGCALADASREYTCFGVPWGVTLPEAEEVIAGTFGGGWDVRENAFWYRVKEYLNKGISLTPEKRGLRASVYGEDYPTDGSGKYQVFGHDMERVMYFFISVPDENGTLNLQDREKTALVCVEMNIALNNDQEYEDLKQQMILELGSVDVHEEKKDWMDRMISWEIWTGADGTYAYLSVEHASEATVRFTFDGMDALLEQVFSAGL